MAAKPIPLTRTEALHPFVRFLDEMGAPTERRLETSRLSPGLVARPQALFALHQGLRFLEGAARNEAIENIGLLVGQRTRIADLGELGRLFSPSMTLHAALLRLSEAVVLFSSAERLSFRREGGHILFCRGFAFGDALGGRHGDLFSLMLMIDAVRLAAGPRWRPCAIMLPASEAVRRKAYDAALETSIVFGGHGYAIVFDRFLLGERLRYFREAEGEAPDPMDLLRASAPAGDFVGTVRQVIASLMPRGHPHIEVVAEVVGLSVRTLQRWLTEAGQSHTRLVEETRLHMANRLLGEDGYKLLDVAYELGYADPANFTRAFRRWTGLTPQEARRRIAAHTCAKRT